MGLCAPNAEIPSRTCDLQEFHTCKDDSSKIVRQNTASKHWKAALQRAQALLRKLSREISLVLKIIAKGVFLKKIQTCISITLVASWRLFKQPLLVGPFGSLRALRVQCRSRETHRGIGNLVGRGARNVQASFYPKCNIRVNEAVSSS